MSKKTTLATKSPSNPAFRGFLNIELSPEDRAIIKSTVYDGALWMVDLDKWIDSGFKFTFSYDDYNHCHQVIAARSDKTHKDFGILMTGRGSTAVKAFKQWIYIQTRRIGDTDWSEILDVGVSKEIDD
jgi:hypothetical protein